MLKPPTASMDNDVQAAVAGEVNDRMAKAVEELGEKYAAGKGGTDVSESGPTGAAYKTAAAKANAEKTAQKVERDAQDAAMAEEQENHRLMNMGSDDEDEDERGDDDAELRGLRQKRLNQIKQREIERLNNLGKGHGQYREVTQDEFLTEVTSSDRVIAHFYHRDFERCKVMDMHLDKLAQRHIETKFIKIDADKAPFFVSKLSVRTMPTLVQFIDGHCRGKQVGFEGLADEMPEGKEDEWPTILLARILARNTMIDKANVVDDDGVERAMKAKLEDARKAMYVGMQQSVFDMDSDDDFDDI